MMVCDDEAVRRDERAASARVEADARFLQMLEPLRRRLEMIFVLELLERRIGEQPHAFVRERGRETSDGYDQGKERQARSAVSHRSCTLAEGCDSSRPKLVGERKLVP